MGLLSWMISVCLLSYALSQDIEASLPNDPDFYVDDEITLTCNFGVRADPTKLSGFGLRVDGTSDIGCSVTKSPGGISVNPNGANEFGPTQEQCDEVYNALLGNTAASLDLKFKVSQAASYRCNTWNVVGVGYEFFGDEYNVSDSDIYTAPTSLTMEIAGDGSPVDEVDGTTGLYAGKTATVTCTSEGGDPAADLEYERDGVVEENGIEQFTVQVADNEAVFSCRDKAHANLQSDPSITRQERKITVYYFKKTEQVAVESLAINPSTTQELKCPTNHNLKEGATIEYRWTQDSVDMEDTTYSIVISADASLNETLIEMYECTASVNGDAKLADTISYKYNITWDVATSTPTTTTSTTPKPTTTGKLSPGEKDMGGDADESKGGKEDKDPTVIIIIIVVVVTVVILVVVIVIIVIKRRSSNSDSKPVSAPAKKDKDAEQGNGDADVTVKEATKPLLTNQESNKSE